jgi:hypothetical protein
MTISSVKTGAIGDSLLAGNPSFIPTSFESIATATGTGSSGTITFSSIPSTYKHLQLRIMGRGSAAADGADVLFRLNSDTASNYAQHTLMGDGSGPVAGGAANTSSVYANYTWWSITAANLTASVMGTIIVDLHDYASTTKNKTLRIFGGYDVNGTGYVYLTSGLWRSTNAVNAITLTLTAGSFTTSSVVSLYGIAG